MKKALFFLALALVWAMPAAAQWGGYYPPSGCQQVPPGYGQGYGMPYGAIPRPPAQPAERLIPGTLLRQPGYNSPQGFVPTGPPQLPPEAQSFYQSYGY